METLTHLNEAMEEIKVKILEEEDEIIKIILLDANYIINMVIE